jgi:molybdenum cofactor cytidylyltransferase
VILAAGVSNRMGRNKMLLDLDGESILRRAVARAVAAGLDPVVVVLGHDADRARSELADLPCEPVVNPDYARGVNVSLRAGIAAVPARARAAVVVLADMPFVTARMIETLVERYRETTAPLVVSDYAGVNAPPILYDRSLFAELGAMEGEGCGKQVVKKHRSEAVAVPWPAEALADVDVPEDYERVKAGLAAG